MPDIGARRVPGLRRGEVAALAGVSVEYYSKLEHGAIAGVSAWVLDAHSPAPSSSTTPNGPICSTSATLPTEPVRACDLAAAPAHAGRPDRAFNGSSTASPPRRSSGTAGMDMLATNHLGRGMHATLYDAAAGATPNFTRFTFLNLDAAHGFYPDWNNAADTFVAILRTEAGRDPHDKDLHDLVRELSTRSDDFRRRWSDHNVRYHGAGTKHFHHPEVGGLELAYESVDMISDPGLPAHPVRRRTRLTHPPTHSTFWPPGPPDRTSALCTLAARHSAERPPTCTGGRPARRHERLRAIVGDSSATPTTSDLSTRVHQIVDMEYRQLGRSCLRVSTITFGTMGFGGTRWATPWARSMWRAPASR